MTLETYSSVQQMELGGDNLHLLIGKFLPTNNTISTLYEIW